MPDATSIFTAEAKALLSALEFISAYDFKNKFIIFTDSFSVLQSLQQSNPRNPVIKDILMKHHELSDRKNIIYCWIPSHVGIPGNEYADKEVKLALNLPIKEQKNPFSDYKPCITKYIHSKWQQSWDTKEFNKLRTIKPLIGDDYYSRPVRRDDVVLTRCRIGHSRLTHSYLLNREDQPECIGCYAPLTIKHILIDCIDMAMVRDRHYQATDMKDL